jgi:hypothetical protein
MLTEIKARLSMPTPAFWKKLQKRTAATSAAFATLTVTVASISNHLPAVLPMALGYVASFFGGIAAICSLAIDDAVPLTVQAGPLSDTPIPPVSE